MKVDRNKEIYPDSGRNDLNGCTDDNDDIPLVDMAINLPPCQIQDLPYHNSVLLQVEFIMLLIGIVYASLLLPKVDHLLCIVLGSQGH